MSKLKYKVEYEFTLEGETHKGVESEASWYLVDQQGNMYSAGPMRPATPIGEQYSKCEPLIKIDEEWLSVDEIEKRLGVNKNIVPKDVREKMTTLDVKMNLDYIATWLSKVIEEGGLSSVFVDSLKEAMARVNNVKIDINSEDAGAGH